MTIRDPKSNFTNCLLDRVNMLQCDLALQTPKSQGMMNPM